LPHIRNEANKNGDEVLGKNLIANGQMHDNSKFQGIEWEHLFRGSHILKDVVSHHNTTNKHHPEYWGTIHDMPKLFIAEMVCDVTARSQEFGTNVREWIADVATEKYGFDMEDKVGLLIQDYLDMILQKPFS